MDITFQNRDEFKRETIADNLITLLESNILISPIVVDGDWGSGKTEFCHKTINKLKSSDKNWITLYIDSFKYDHLEDPLLMLITQIASILPDDKTKSDYLKKALPLLKVMSKVAGKMILNWMLKSDIDEVGKVIKDELESMLDLGLKNCFESFEKMDESIVLFKKTLESITETQKLIIFIDEMDRCRPNFSLGILEKVKHVFDTKNVEFVFFTNLNQVQAMVKKQYGYEIDAEKYLAKFFPVTIQLPSIHGERMEDYSQNSYKLFKELVNPIDCFSCHFYQASSIDKFFKEQFKLDNLTLRDAEKFFKMIQINNILSESDKQISNKSHWMYVTLVLIGVYASSFKKNFAYKLSNMSFEFEDILEFFHVQLDEYKQDQVSQRLRFSFFSVFLYDLDDMVLNRVFDDQDKVKMWNQRVENLFTGWVFSPERSRRTVTSSNVIKRLQLMSS